MKLSVNDDSFPFFNPQEHSIYLGSSENSNGSPACIQSQKGHILTVSDSEQVIFQVSKDSCFLSSDRVNERTNERNVHKLFETVPFEPDHDIRTHLSEHESESNSLIRKLLRKEESSKAGTERHGVEPLVNVRCHNFHNMLGRLFFQTGGGVGGGGVGGCE